MVSEPQLRTLYSRKLEDRGTGRERCVSPEHLAALVLRRGPERRRLVTLDHVMACGPCRADFELLFVAITASRAVDTRD